VAEGIFNKLNTNVGITCESAGIFLDKNRPYICDNVLTAMKNLGYDLFGDFSLVSSLNLNNYDKIVVVAGDVDNSSFDGFDGEIVNWNILDCSEDDVESIKKSIGSIEANVGKLLEDLNFGN
jgi:protein-tyrosine-phosphatase